jgi:two-component system LytT family sensor kinase
MNMTTPPRSPADTNAADPDMLAAMLADPSHWRAEDARVNPRVALASIVAMWLVYFVVTTGLTTLIATSDAWTRLFPRILVVLAGMVCTYILLLLIQRVQPRRFGARLALSLGVAVPLVIAYSIINMVALYYWFPTDEVLTLITQLHEKYGDSWQWITIADSSVRWYFFFAAWASLYVALGYANEMRALERRANEYRLEAKNAQIRALHYQINPHFLFNTLNSLSTLVMRGSSVEAEAMIMNLSSFLRSCLEMDPEKLVTLDDEIALQTLYLDIERVRFPNRLAVHFDVSDAARTAMVPVLILQPLIENAIKYAVSPSRGNISVRIHAHVDSAMLHLTVENDMDYTATPPPSGTGLGLRNVRERLLTRFGTAAGCDNERRDDGGFIVRLWLPHGQ